MSIIYLSGKGDAISPEQHEVIGLTFREPLSDWVLSSAEKRFVDTNPTLTGRLLPNVDTREDPELGKKVNAARVRLSVLMPELESEISEELEVWLSVEEPPQTFDHEDVAVFRGVEESLLLDAMAQVCSKLYYASPQRDV